MRTIGIDCRFAGTRSGVGRYTEELVRSLLKRNDPWCYVLFGWPIGALHAMPLHEIRMQYKIVPVPYRHYSIAEQFHFPRLLKKHQIDLLHVPHFNIPLFCGACPSKRGTRSGVPFVATIHDLILHRYPNQASLMKKLAYRVLMNHAVKKSSHIFAVSAFTAGEIQKTYGKSIQKKMTVTHEGVTERFHPASEEEKIRIRKTYELPSSFLLYTGACKEHKNVQALIDAVSEDHILILITGGKEVRRLRLKPNVRILTNIPGTDLPILMSTASVYVQPSLYEGFGLPVLEAMACGTPVVATGRSSIPEIAGNHAILVEPTIEGLKNGIDFALSHSLDLHAAKHHTRSFSWEKMAQETATIYASLLLP